MFEALKRCVKRAVFINIPRARKLHFLTDYKNVIHKKIVNVNPDLVLIYSKDIPHEVLKKIAPLYKTAIFYPDIAPSDKKLAEFGKLVDYVFITNKTHLKHLQMNGIKKSIFCMQGCDPKAHRIVSTRNKKWASEVAFIGKPVVQERIDLLKLIDRNYKLKAWGGDWGSYGLTCLKKNIYPKEFAKICYACPIMIGSDFVHNLECYFSNRTWITLGCGGFLLTSYSPGLETVFTKGGHLEWYHTHQECLDLIKYYLRNEDQRKKIAMAGYKFAHSSRTYDIVINEIISQVDAQAQVDEDSPS